MFPTGRIGLEVGGGSWRFRQRPWGGQKYPMEPFVMGHVRALGPYSAHGPLFDLKYISSEEFESRRERRSSALTLIFVDCGMDCQRF
jgi:hypothetical protein